jgi:hypothetical protein
LDANDFRRGKILNPILSVLPVPKSLFGCAFQPAFRQILNLFFAKIECGLYFLDRFDVLMLKMIFKK